MKLDQLSTEEIKDIMKQLLYKVEADESLVDKHILHRNVQRQQDSYIINFYNGYEHKVCVIDDNKANISSESHLENLELTKFYKSLLQSKIDLIESMKLAAM